MKLGPPHNNHGDGHYFDTCDYCQENPEVAELVLRTERQIHNCRWCGPNGNCHLASQWINDPRILDAIWIEARWQALREDWHPCRLIPVPPAVQIYVDADSISGRNVFWVSVMEEQE